MKTRYKYILFPLLMLISMAGYCQKGGRTFRRELSEVHDEWHKLILPESIYAKAKSDFSDVRVVGVNSKGDSLEAPYILQVLNEKFIDKDVEFAILNKSRKKDIWYYTFEIPEVVSMNEILLSFNTSNFDWKVSLAGGQSLDDWFTILEDYRIISIKSSLTSYQFTKLSFPSSKYKYYRVGVTSLVDPEFLSANLRLRTNITGTELKYQVVSIKGSLEESTKQLSFFISLQQPSLVSKIAFKVNSKFDYCRPISIQTLEDSVKTQKGWHYNYQTIYKGNLSSLEESEFSFNEILSTRMKIVIDNFDNAPLDIDSFQVSGDSHQMIIRFDKEAHYYLTYGNRDLEKPIYDIINFEDKIPQELKLIRLGTEEVIAGLQEESVKPLFANKNWLWAIMVVIIFVLGYFSLGMIRQKE